MDRRAFCRSAAAGIAMAGIARRSHAAAQRQEAAASAISAVIYDERYQDACEFAAALRLRGATAFPIQGCSSGCWYGELGERLRQRGSRVAGLTSYADLLIARSCGREMALRSLFEGTHDARGPDRVRHLYRISAPAPFLSSLARGEALIPSGLADILTRIGDGGATGWSMVEAEGRRRSDHPGYLTSWLLGPRTVASREAGSG